MELELKLVSLVEAMRAQGWPVFADVFRKEVDYLWSN
jgi:hypothetical protein